MTDFHIRDRCRLCDDTRLTKLLDLGSTPLANEYPKEPVKTARRLCPDDYFPLYLVGCERCGHVQLPVVVKAERLFPPDYPYQSGTSAVFRKHLEGLREVVLPLFARTPSVWGPNTLLEIASNDGSFLELFRDDEEVQTLGIDPAAEQAERANLKGVTTLPEFFTKANAEVWQRRYSYAKAIVALNVFAHVDDMNDFTAGVAKMLVHDGAFIFEVGYLPDVVTKGLFDVVYHEHLSYHHLTPLLPFFRRHGMTVYDAHRIDSQGGSIRVFVRNCEGFEAPSERMQALLDEEAHPSRPGLWDGVRRLHHLAERYVGDQIRAFGKQCRGNVAYYGAPAKLTTLLAATGAPMPRFVVDDNPLKVGRYVPGTTVPILPTSALYEKKPAGVVISSWNFAADIQARHHELGARWFTPLPCPPVHYGNGVWIHD
jgi:SAM-dependent methyltransferase